MHTYDMWNGVVIAFIIIFVDIFVAYLAFEIAKQKGYDSISWAVLFFFLPPIGYIFLIAMPDKTAQAQNERIIQLLEDARRTVPAQKAKRTVTYGGADYDISEPWVCHHCGHTNEPNYLFCLNCNEPRQPEQQK